MWFRRDEMFISDAWPSHQYGNDTGVHRQSSLSSLTELGMGTPCASRESRPSVFLRSADNDSSVPLFLPRPSRYGKKGGRFDGPTVRHFRVDNIHPRCLSIVLRLGLG